MAIGLCSALKKNQWLRSVAAQPMAGNLARMGGASGYIHQGSSDFFSFADNYKIFALRDSKPSPLNEPSQRIQTSLCSADSPLHSSPQRLQHLARGFPAAIQRLSSENSYESKCRIVFVTRAGLPCTLLTNMASVIHAFSCLFAVSFLFREQLRPSCPPAFFLPGPSEEKAAGQRISALGDEWAYPGFTPTYLTHSQPRTSLTPNREFSPVLFTRPDQHLSAAASDLVSFGGSNDSEMDDSLSLAASDAGSYHKPTLLYYAQPRHGRRYFPHPV